MVPITQWQAPGDTHMMEENKSASEVDSIGKENEPPELQVFTPVKNCSEESKSVFSE